VSHLFAKEELKGGEEGVGGGAFESGDGEVEEQGGTPPSQKKALSRASRGTMARQEGHAVLRVVNTAKTDPRPPVHPTVGLVCGLAHEFSFLSCCVCFAGQRRCTLQLALLTISCSRDIST